MQEAERRSITNGKSPVSLIHGFIKTTQRRQRYTKPPRDLGIDRVEPSEKYSWSGSLDRLAKGKTAMDLSRPAVSRISSFGAMVLVLAVTGAGTESSST